MKPTQIRFLIFACLVILSIGLVFNHPWLFKLIIGPAYLGAPLSPFLDMHGQLASAQAWAAGFDVLNNPNPLDLLHRPHHGPTWMLLMGHLGLGTKHTLLLAFLSITGVLTISFALLRPRFWYEVLLGWLVICSPACFFAYERANIDITLFCVLSLATYFSTKDKARYGWAAWLLIAVNIGFKYFPTAAFLTLVDPKWGKKRFIAFASAGTIAVSLYIAIYWEELLWVKEKVSPTLSHYTFGGSNLWRLIGIPYDQVFLLTTGLVSLLIALFATLGTRTHIRFPEADRWEGTFFIFAASTMTFCFATSVSFDYRLIFFIPAFPLLFRSIRKGALPTLPRALCILTLSLLYFHLWAESIFFFIYYVPTSHAWNNTYFQEFLILKNLTSWLLMTLIIWMMTFILVPKLKNLLKN